MADFNLKLSKELLNIDLTSKKIDDFFPLDYVTQFMPVYAMYLLHQNEMSFEGLKEYTLLWQIVQQKFDLLKLYTFREQFMDQIRNRSNSFGLNELLSDFFDSFVNNIDDNGQIDGRSILDKFDSHKRSQLEKDVSEKFFDKLMNDSYKNGNLVRVFIGWLKRINEKYIDLFYAAKEKNESNAKLLKKVFFDNNSTNDNANAKELNYLIEEMNNGINKKNFKQVILSLRGKYLETIKKDRNRETRCFCIIEKNNCNYLSVSGLNNSSMVENDFWPKIKNDFSLGDKWNLCNDYSQVGIFESVKVFL